MRKYERIWEQVKSDTRASIIAPVEFHARIIQAVRKEKTKDLGWKYVLLETGKRFELQERIEGKLITFFLVDTSAISVDML